MFKRVMLFILTNLAIMAVVSIILAIFHVNPELSANGLDYKSLLIFSAIFGFVGSFISLLMSKFIAKHAYGVQLIERPANAKEQWLVQAVQGLARKVGVNPPEIGIYQGEEPNAFATGWSRNNALVAVSSGILNDMTETELTGVLGHELSHVANGDMVTMALIQGIVNTFVIFFARIAAYFVATFISREEGEGVSTLAYSIVAIVFQIVFGILASMIVMAFSRWREFRADKGSAKLTGKDTMIAALKRLQQYSAIPDDNRSPATSAFMINRHTGFMKLFSSHPSLEERIAALEHP